MSTWKVFVFLEDKTWTAHQVELTLWTFQFLKLNDPPLLIEAIEGSSKRKQENSNGDAKSNKKLKPYILCALIVSVKSILKLNWAGKSLPTFIEDYGITQSSKHVTISKFWFGKLLPVRSSIHV